MGWCSGTRLFDEICELLLDKKRAHPVDRFVTLIKIFESDDWDCQLDSDYYDHPVVNQAFRKLHPDWFEEGEDDGSD
jgi:hypothetical protein